MNDFLLKCVLIVSINFQMPEPVIYRLSHRFKNREISNIVVFVVVWPHIDISVGKGMSLTSSGHDQRRDCPS